MSVLLENRFLRRIVTVPTVVVASTLSVVLAPLTFVGSLIVDLLRSRSTIFRKVVFFTTALVIEVLGLVVSLLLWVVTGFGLARCTRWSRAGHARLMGIYASTLLGLIAWAIGRRRLDVRGAEVLSPGPVIVAARHTSFFDALIPAALMQHKQHRLVPHHVLASELLVAPCIDIVGHRLANVFVHRSNSRARGHREQLDRIRELGTTLEANSGAVIFPEGTFRTPRRFAKAIDRARRRDPDLGDRLNELAYMLPPYPNGIYELLMGCPSADLVLCLNTGLEAFGSAAAILNLASTHQPITVECWRFERTSIPTSDQHAFEQWLVDRWFEVDAWVATELSEFGC